MPLNQKRPAILVNTLFKYHEQIERFLAVCREGHFGAPPENGAGYRRRNSFGGGGGGLGGGGGGFGGGGQF